MWWSLRSQQLLQLCFHSQKEISCTSQCRSSAAMQLKNVSNFLKRAVQKSYLNFCQCLTSTSCFKIHLPIMLFNLHQKFPRYEKYPSQVPNILPLISFLLCNRVRNQLNDLIILFTAKQEIHLNNVKIMNTFLLLSALTLLNNYKAFPICFSQVCESNLNQDFSQQKISEFQQLRQKIICSALRRDLLPLYSVPSIVCIIDLWLPCFGLKPGRSSCCIS